MSDYYLQACDTDTPAAEYFKLRSAALWVALLVSPSVDRSLVWPPKFPTQPSRLKFGIEVCVRVCVCVCVNANWLKGVWQLEWPIFKKAHDFQIDSQTCSRFSGKMVMSQRTND